MAARNENPLVDLAAMLEPDGGMPGDGPDTRARRTIAALLAFVAEGHTLTTGAFRVHVARLVRFLKSVSPAEDRHAPMIERVLDAASSGKAPAGEWMALALKPGIQWKEIEAGLKERE